MKKMFILVTIGSIIFTSCGKSEKEFDEKLNAAEVNIMTTMLMDAVVHDAVLNAWHDAIYKNRTPSGKYCDDINDALKEVKDSITHYKMDEKARENNERLLQLASEMASPPSSRKDCYEDFIEIVTEVSTLTRTTLDISGSYKTYSQKTGELFDEISKKRDQFTIKYGSLLKKSEETTE